ncbi:MAG: enoyl-CoA hydratase-related protein, partial [Pseudomonadota bacterium]
FALPEPKVGLAALAGGLHRLPRQIGLKRAMGMILTGRTVSAEEGERLGFVNAVVPADKLMDTAMIWAEMILACSPMSIRASKQAVMQGLDIADYKQAFETRYPAVGDMLKSEDMIEGPRAFAEKRKPNWSGK